MNLIVGTFTALVVAVTLVCAFVFPSFPPEGVNVFFAICIVLICGSHLVLVSIFVIYNNLDPGFCFFKGINAC